VANGAGWNWRLLFAAWRRAASGENNTSPSGLVIISFAPAILHSLLNLHILAFVFLKQPRYWLRSMYVVKHLSFLSLTQPGQTCCNNVNSSWPAWVRGPSILGGHKTIGWFVLMANDNLRACATPPRLAKRRRQRQARFTASKAIATARAMRACAFAVPLEGAVHAAASLIRYIFVDTSLRALHCRV